MKKDEKNSSPAKLSVSDSFTAKIIDRFLDYLKKASWSGRILKSEALCGSIGLYGIYFIGVMGFVFALCLPLKIPGFGFVPALLAGICVLLAAVFLNFAAYKMLPSLKLLIDGTPVRISSPAFFTVSAVFSGVVGLLVLASATVIAIQRGSFGSFVYGIFVFICAEYVMLLLLNPSVLKVEVVRNVSAGEEFIGILSFFMKAMLKLVPLIFAAAMLFGAYRIVAMIFTSYVNFQQFYGDVRVLYNASMMALLPLSGYLLFLFYYFAIDLAKALLDIPGKLDKLNNSK